MKTIFRDDSTQSIQVVVALVAALLVMVADAGYGQLNGFRTVLSTTVSPVHIVASGPSDFSAWVGEVLVSRKSLLEENRALKGQMLAVQNQIKKMASLRAENVRLRELLNSAALVHDEVLVAEVLTAAPDPSRREIVINQGSEAGVQIGQPVLDAQGLMGQVIEASAVSSRVLLLSDLTHALSVENLRNGLRTVVAGKGASEVFDVLYMPDTADIRVGDLLVSSGLGGMYPRGYPVATVTSIQHSPVSDFAIISAKPAARLDQSRHVLLMMGNTDSEALFQQSGVTQ